MDGKEALQGTQVMTLSMANALKGELLHMITDSGQQPDADILTQISKAVMNDVVHENEVTYFENERVLTFD